MKLHPESLIQLHELGRRIPAYQPTFDFAGSFVDAYHQWLHDAPPRADDLVELRSGTVEGNRIIDGWLRREDALKLYELAYCVRGNILELGSYHGLSTAIIATASRNSPWPKRVYSVDLNGECVAMTARNMNSLGLAQYVTSLCGEASDAIRQLGAAGGMFSFIFIDHSHAYEPVLAVCRELHRVLVSGGFCLFHDYNDARNTSPDDTDYGVYQAVHAALSPGQYEFCGVYGCTGLFRFR